MLSALLANDMILTVGMVETLNKIFSAVTIGNINKDNPKLEEKAKVFKVCMSKFIGYFPDNIFKDEYAFFYEMMVHAKIKIYSQSQLDDIIDNNRDLILDSPYIDLEKWSRTTDDRGTTDDEKIEAFKEELIELFDRLSNNYVSEEEFLSSCEIFIDYYKTNYMAQVAQRMAMIMSDTGMEEKLPNKRRRHYKGFNDAQQYYNEKMMILRALSDTDRIKYKLIDEDWLQDELEKEKSIKEVEVLDFGLEEIDSTTGGLLRSNMLGILGAPKRWKN